MKIIFYSSFHFENWDWTNSIEKGIGGSETSAVEMAWRLAQRGHEVICYAPVPWKGTKEWRGTKWTHYKNADFKEDGLWIIYRTPETMDNFGPKRPEQPRWLMCQDAHYGQALDKERAEKFDKILALCVSHAEHLAEIYPIKDKIWLTSNGVKMELVREVEKLGIVRNPKKLVYASSPDRGLIPLLKIFKKAKELDPELELHIFYGFNNIDKLLSEKKGGSGWRQDLIDAKAEITKLLKQPGVIFRGRVSQKELYMEWLSANIWCYPTEFAETSCITCMEAQALGAIPITAPIWGLKDNVGWGISLEGNVYSDELLQARYVAEIIRLTRNLKMAEAIREPMMRWARMYHNWEHWVDQWEDELAGLPCNTYQFHFQHLHAKGKILNVGCDTDPTGFAQRGATNLDVIPNNPKGEPNKFHVLHDIRQPLPENLGKFDTIILGDIMEHIELKEWAKTLKNCRKALTKDGQIIITCPNDFTRAPEEQHVNHDWTREYTDGVHAYHYQEITHQEILKQLKLAGLVETLYLPADYSLFEGHHLICQSN